MKTRIIHTDIHEKLVKWNAPQEVRRLYPYLLTNKRINISGIYELADQYIHLETLLTPKELASAKQWLEERGKAKFYNGWVHVPNVDEYNNYKKSEKNVTAYENELKKIPEYIRIYFLENLRTSIDTSIDTNSDTSIGTNSDTSRNQKSEINNQKSEDKGIVKGKEKEDPIASFFENPPEEIVAKYYDKFNVSKAQIISKAEDLYYWWRKLSPKRRKEYSDPEAILRNALKKDFGLRIKAPVHVEIPVGERVSAEKMQEFRVKLTDIAKLKSINGGEVESNGG